MSLKDRLLSELKQSMKDKDVIKKASIIMVRADILQMEKDQKVELSDEEIIGIIAKQVKQRRASLHEFEKANREDLIEQSKKEIEVLTAYLPQQLSEEEIQQIVTHTIKETGASSMKDMGKVMSALMPKVKGKADGGLVSKYVKENLQ